MRTNDRFRKVLEQLAPLRAELLEHSIYRQITSPDSLHVFMQHHVFAVWDFMSLLKALQRRLCCVDVPWLPPVNHLAVRLVNEIVLGEESDEDGQGGFGSHFDLYHRAMRRCGADTAGIDRFLERLRSGLPIDSALAEAQAPTAIRPFIRHTFQVIEGDDLCEIASAFTFGREDLLPEVFQRIVDELNVESDNILDDFRFYLSRHIELDGEQHGPMAARLIASLCCDDETRWKQVEQAGVAALGARKLLWDGMLAAMQGDEPVRPAGVPESLST